VRAVSENDVNAWGEVWSLSSPELARSFATTGEDRRQGLAPLSAT